jgi:TolB-like protein
MEVSREVFKPVSVPRKSNKTKIIAGSLILLALIIIGSFFVPKLVKSEDQLKRSIAVLPFINDNPSDTNNPIINGISRDISSNLQSIKDLSVVSQYSVGKYKDPSKYKIREIAKDLVVNYLVTGTGQKYGNNLILRVELIDAINDRTLWSKPYQQEIRETKDIFSLQSQIAQSIAAELKAIITPEEKQLIEKVPTSDLTAYDFYQRGREEHAKYQFVIGNMEALTKAEALYKKALEYDPTFAQAYTGLAAVYWDKHYSKEYFSENFMDSVLFFTKVALSYNDQLDEAYTIRGNYYYEKGLPEQAIKEFDKALKINPNSWRAYKGKGVLSSDSDILSSIENFQKAASLNHGSELPGILRDIAEGYQDAGFTEKAKYFVLEAFKLDGDSVKYFTELGYLEHKLANYEKSVEFLERSYDLDTTNIFTLYYLAENCGFAGQMEKSLKYCKEFVTRRKNLGAEYFFAGAINHRIGYAYWENGYKKESEYYFNKQLEECNNQIKSIRPWSQLYYTYYDIAGVYAFRGDKDKAYKNLRIFNQRKLQPLWMLSLIKNDPLFNSMRNEPEFQQIFRDVEAKYQAEHERVRKWLEEQGTL